MEKFVAVKPVLDYEIGLLNHFFAAELEGKTFTGPADITIHYTGNSDQFLADLLYSKLLVSLKRDALLFDRIYVLWTNQLKIGRMAV